MALPFLPLILGTGALGTAGAALFGSGGPEQQPSNIPPALQPGLAPSMPMLTGPSSMARYGVPMAPVPPKQNIGTNEMLARSGGAIMSNAAQGGPAAYGAGLEAYGSMMDQNRELERQSAVDQYNAAAAQQSALGKMKPQVAPLGANYTNAALMAIEKIENAVASGEESGMNPFDDVTGLAGAFMKNIPGSNANDVAAAIETVVSSIGFDRLQAMRDASPTGGALGQVSERELGQLNASIGNLRQSQSLGAFKSNLAIVKADLQRTVYFMNLRVQEYNAQMQGLAPSSNVSVQQLYNNYTGQASGSPAQPAQPQQAAPAAPPAASAPAPTPGPQGAPITNPPPVLVPAPPQQQQQPAARTTTTGVQYRALPPSN
jgi:hypothetical protein